MFWQSALTKESLLYITLFLCTLGPYKCDETLFYFSLTKRGYICTNDKIFWFCYHYLEDFSALCSLAGVLPSPAGWFSPPPRPGEAATLLLLTAPGRATSGLDTRLVWPWRAGLAPLLADCGVAPGLAFSLVAVLGFWLVTCGVLAFWLVGWGVPEREPWHHRIKKLSVSCLFPTSLNRTNYSGLLISWCLWGTKISINTSKDQLICLNM